MKATKSADPSRIPFWKMLAWNSRTISQGIGLMVIGFLQIYCTDTLKMNPALVGGLLVASRLLDGFTDLFAGYIVDRTNTKWGRGRPYELCIVAMWLCIWGMFSCPPAIGTAAKIGWIIATYTLVNSVFYTFLNANNTVYMCRAFKYNEQYVVLNSSGAIISMIFVAAFNIAAPALIDRFGNTSSGWSFLIACIAIPGAIIGLLRFVFIKETNGIDVKAANGMAQKVNFGDVCKVLTGNRYIYIVAFILFVANFVTNMGINMYYFRYIVKDLTMLSLISAVQILTIPVMLLIPHVLKKITIAKLIMIGCFLSATGYVINYFAGGNIVLLGIAASLYGVGAMPVNMMINLMIIECADYNEWKGMQRMEGTIGCVTGFATKVGSSLGAGVLGGLLAVSGYAGDAQQIPDSALSMIRNLFSTIPATLWAVTGLTILMYALDKMIPKIREENKARRALKAEMEEA